MGIEQPSTKQTFDQELIGLIRKTKEYCLADRISKTLYETKTISYCYLITIGQIIIGTLGALQQEDCLVFHITQRSLFEYSLELMIIVKQDDLQFNKQFADYHRLSIYLKRDAIDRYKDQIPIAHEKYLSAIVNTYPEFLENTSDVKSGLIIPDWDKVKKVSKKRITKGWMGLSYTEKLYAVLVMYSVKADCLSALKKWQTVSQRLQSSLGSKWDSLSFNEKSDMIIKEIQAEAGKQPLGLKSLEPQMQLFQKGFRFSSEYTHPTPRSVVPHLNLKKGTFELDYHFKEKSVQEAKNFLYLVYSSAVRAVSPFFNQVEGRPLAYWFDKWTAQSPAIWNRLLSKAK